MIIAEKDQSLNQKKLDKKEELNKIRQEVASCFLCKLSKTRTNTVPGEGNPNAQILFVGEAPGATEDQKGVPFCGAAGKFLDEMLQMIDMKREDVFIANTLKCRPPQNRDPEDEEKEVCRRYLDCQFKIIDPKLIVCLGRHSVATFLPGLGTITTLHGKACRRSDGRVYLSLYHPAAALHNGSLRQTLIEDFKKIPAILKKIEQEEIQTKTEENFNQAKLV